MAQGPMRGAALAAVLAAATCERARDCPRLLPCSPGHRGKGQSQPACPGQPQSGPQASACPPRLGRARCSCLAGAGR
jgi:hypothetical protein